MNYIGQLQYNVNIGNNKIGNFELLDNNTKNILDIMKTKVGLSDTQKCYISKLGI
jgi:hypothetical protein